MRSFALQASQYHERPTRGAEHHRQRPARRRVQVGHRTVSRPSRVLNARRSPQVKQRFGPIGLMRPGAAAAPGGARDGSARTRPPSRADHRAGPAGARVPAAARRARRGSRRGRAPRVATVGRSASCAIPLGKPTQLDLVFLDRVLPRLVHDVAATGAALPCRRAAARAPEVERRCGGLGHATGLRGRAPAAPRPNRPAGSRCIPRCAAG